MLGLDDHTSAPVPALRRIRERTKNTLRLARAAELPLGPLDLVACGALQDRILGQPQDVADAVRVAPAHQSPAAESAVGPDRDLHLRPGGAKPPHQQFEHGTSMLARVDVAGAEVGREQLIATEDVQW